MYNRPVAVRIAPVEDNITTHPRRFVRRHGTKFILGISVYRQKQRIFHNTYHPQTFCEVVISQILFLLWWIYRHEFDGNPFLLVNVRYAKNPFVDLVKFSETLFQDLNVRGPVVWELPYGVIMTLSNRNIFRATGPLCGNSSVTGEFPSHRLVTQGFDVFFNLRLNKRLNK